MDSGPTHVASASEGQLESDRRIIVRAMRTGLWVWPAFTVLDVYMCFAAFPGARFWLFIVYRAVVELLFLALYRASQRPNADITALFRWLNLMFGIAAVAISLMAIDVGGIRSPYMHGISIVSLIRAALVPTHWRRSVRAYGRIGLAFPLVMGLGAIISPVYRADWMSADALIAFTSNYVFVIASSFLGMVSGHLAWTAQEQLYRARRVGRYRLQAPIGKGGMGDVWLAWDLSLRRNVALKILRASSVPSPDTLKRFEREAQAAGQLRDQHVVQVFDFGASDDGLYYIAMEYLPGLNLATLVEEFGPLPPARAISAIMQACRALEEAHAAGIIHRDLKPHNLFMTRVGDDPDFVKLLDFGVARLRDANDAAESLTWTGLVVGTPNYIAPELLHGAPADERSDLYALGATLHFLVSGSTPRVNRASGIATEPTHAHLGEAALERYDRVPAWLRPILHRCLAMSPDDRFQSARDLSDALARVYEPAEWKRADAQEFWRDVDRRRFGATQPVTS
jgi:serine/threonine-protein kinase